ncbi:MAG: transporter [Rhodospirillaceae bacterium]
MTKFIAMAIALLAAASPSRAQQVAAAASATDAAIDAILLAENATSYWEVSSGFDHSRGTYGALTPTTISFVPLGLAYRTGGLTLSVDAGFVHVKGPLDYIDVAELLGIRGAASALPRVVKGIGDSTIAAKYSVLEDFENGVFLDAGARLRVPTASRSRGLGTGHLAGELQLDVLKVLGRWSVFANAGYGIRDRRDADRNPWSASVGLGRGLTDKLSAGAFYQWRQSLRQGGAAAHEMFAYVSHRFSDRFTLTVYGATGFSIESVDRQIGLRYSYRWP